MNENCGQRTIRQRLADATREELLEIVVAREGIKTEGRDWFNLYAAADHRVRRLEALLASRYHREGLERAIHVADLETKNRRLREEIRTMQLAAERHNREAFATGLIIKCTGCDAGGPFGELTEERVCEVERIAARLRAWWTNHRGRQKRNDTSATASP